jgi:FkbM family methyltransferase
MLLEHWQMTDNPKPPSAGAVETMADMSAASGRWDFRGHSDQPFGPTTYAQFGEDLILLNIFHMLGIERPRFIDIGAHHPVHISNTALLYARGSRGVNIEPNPNLIAAFAQARPEDITLNIGVGPHDGVLDFYMIDDHSGRNTFDRATAEAFVAAEPRHSIRTVQRIPVRALDAVVHEHCGGCYPHLLTIDAEGLDYPILEAAHFGPEGPVVICVETGDDSDRLSALMRERGYVPFVRTVSNAIYVRAAEANRYNLLLH